jgi:hypothetical protein
MTEAEWLACTDPRPMLEYLRGRASERKLRLFYNCCHPAGAMPESEEEERMWRYDVQNIRDIFGNPFRPIPLDGASLTATVNELAAAIYDDRAFERLPILADALEDAGCGQQDILNHLRQPGFHVRGCWPLDLILGKEPSTNWRFWPTLWRWLAALRLTS